MGKVKQLWEEEREKALAELVTVYLSDGYTLEEAEEMAANDMADQDEANGQFGVGA